MNKNNNKLKKCRQVAALKVSPQENPHSSFPNFSLFKWKRLGKRNKYAVETDKTASSFIFISEFYIYFGIIFLIYKVIKGYL